MESAHPTTDLDAPLDDLAEVFSTPGPVLTAVLDTDAEVERAADLSAAHWSAQRQEAEALGAPDQALAAIDPLVAEAHLRGPRLFALADETGLRLSEPISTGDPTISWAPLPSMVPLIHDRQGRVPVLLARCDRRGADLCIIEPLASHELGSVEQVDGHERKVHAGGWSNPRFQRRAENTLEGTAEEIAEAVVAAAAQLGDRGVVVLVGDDRTVDSVAERLPGSLDVRHAPGGRDGDGSDDDVLHEVERIRDTVAAERTVAAMRAVREGVPQGHAVEGVDAVMLALAESRVQRLLVAERGNGSPTARLDPATGLPLVDDGAAHDGEPVAARAADVAVRAALATGASIRVTPSAGGPADGLGALLRWDEPRQG